MRNPPLHNLRRNNNKVNIIKEYGLSNVRIVGGFDLDRVITYEKVEKEKEEAFLHRLMSTEPELIRTTTVSIYIYIHGVSKISVPLRALQEL